ncbi:MAG: ATP-binding protein [Candidatus Paceibacterota bacterium]|jgi:signal transduction histidine kinase
MNIISLFFSYNNQENLQICGDIVAEASKLLFYSHIPTMMVALIIGFFVLYKNRANLLSKILFGITFLFAIWNTLDLFVWFYFDNSTLTTFLWSFFGVIYILIYVLSLYFVVIFINGKDVSLSTKVIIGLIISPIILLIPTTYNISGFSTVDCVALEGSVYTNYYLFLGLVFALFIILFTVYKWRKIDKILKKQLVLLILGVESFLLIFFMTVWGMSYLIDNGYVAYSNYNIEQYGLFSMPIFMAFLAYLIVKFKTFDIKLIGSQALIVAMVALVGSQFFFIQSDMNRILTAITLVILGVVGISLIRSVKREVELREQKERLAGELAVSNEKLKEVNQGQSSLIHFMNHQIKGRFGNIKNIFAELLTDDYGTMPPATMPLIQKGLDESNVGVMYVTNILKGASAEKGTLQYEMKQMDVKTITEEVFSKEKERAEKKGLQFNLNVESGDYSMSGDPIQLGEAIRNLIDNSINYTPTGNVAVNLSLTDGKILLKVIDTGVGIMEEDKERLFKAGGRGVNSLKVNVNATGYGLVFVKNVAIAHKGRVWVDSDGNEKGSTFYLELPKNQ